MKGHTGFLLLLQENPLSLKKEIQVTVTLRFTRDAGIMIEMKIAVKQTRCAITRLPHHVDTDMAAWIEEKQSACASLVSHIHLSIHSDNLIAYAGL